MKTNKEDIRIVKTKKALFNAFISLIEEKPFEDITVNELCEKAGIRRATFYKHYKDKNDFTCGVAKMLREEFDLKLRNNKGVPTAEYYIQYVRQLTKFMYENKRFVKGIMNSEMRFDALNLILLQNFEDTRARLYEDVEKGMHLAASPDTTALMLTGGVAQCIIHFFDNGRESDTEELLLDLTRLINRILS